MRKKKFTATAVALAMAAITVFSVGNTPSVKAADVADKSAISIAVDGDYEEKSLSKADREAIANQLGYEYFSGDVAVCGSNTTAYVDWENSSIPYWKVYKTEVFAPDLSRDTNGNLIVKTDDNGNIVEKETYGSQDVYATDKYGSSVFFATRVGGEHNFLPSSNGKNVDIGFSSNFAYNEVNTNMGASDFSEAYIVRIYYTTDDKLNYTLTDVVNETGHGAYDINGNYIDFEGDLTITEYNKDRTFGYTDFWILPEGVSTVLNFEDETPAPSPSEDNYTVDLGDSQIVSADTFATILAENAAKDVIIKSNNNVTFTFAKGTMASVDGKTEYDFSTSINSAYADTMPSYITKDNFVSQINFNYSGKLPATANIRFYAGTEYAGQTFYYSLMNADNTFAEVQAVVVDADGYMTVKQDHCSSYVVTKTEPKLPSNDDTKNDDGNASNNGGSSDNGNTSNNGNASTSDNNTSSGNTTVSTDKNASSANTTATSPKTGDMTPIAIYIVMAVAAVGVIVFVKRRKTA